MSDHKKSTETMTLEQAAEKVRLAQDNYDDAKDKAEHARRRETSAFNALNDAQKEFDAVVAQMREGAPRDSDWAKSQRR